VLTDAYWRSRFDAGVRSMAPAESRAYYRQALETAANIPGVREAAVSGALPLDFDSGVLFTAGGQPANQDGLTRVVSRGFFHLLAIPLMRGRGFTEGDSETAPRVAIVNQNFARKVFGAESPVGKSITLEPQDWLAHMRSALQPWRISFGVSAVVG
jgi:hypothetical protein